jgi:hypothetical protein
MCADLASRSSRRPRWDVRSLAQSDSLPLALIDERTFGTPRTHDREKDVAIGDPDPALPTYKGLDDWVEGEYVTRQVSVPQTGIDYDKHEIDGYEVDPTTVVVTMTDTKPESRDRPPLPPGSESLEAWEVIHSDHLQRWPGRHNRLHAVRPRLSAQ